MDAFKENVILYVCGARGTAPVSGGGYMEYGGETSCFVLTVGNRAVVVDCGTGLLNAGELLRNCTDIAVLITHMHYDHLLGLLDAIEPLQNGKVRFFCPGGSIGAAGTLQSFMRPPFWPVVFSKAEAHSQALEPGADFFLWEDVRVRAMEANHPNGGLLYRVDTPEGGVAFAFDHEHGKCALDGFVEGCSVIVYDGMFTDEEYPQHAGWGHSTWQEGVRLASRVQPDSLLVTHHKTTRTDKELNDLESQAQNHFLGCRFARAGDACRLSQGRAFPAKNLSPSALSLNKILEMGVALSAETDQNKLLDSILTTACRYTNADGGTLYILEHDKLLFRIMYNKSLGIHKGQNGKPMEFPPPVPLSKEYVASYAALTGQMINVPDVYKSDVFDFSGPCSYDKMTGYHTKSMLVAPLHNTEREVIGVLQLINAVDAAGNAVPFSTEYEQIVRTLSSFSAIALSNMSHQREIKRLMFSFFNVIISAVDERTPYNASHTTRIVEMLLSLIGFINETPWVHAYTGCFDKNRMEVFVMSAWLHDVGKLITPLSIINKATRLGAADVDIRQRFRAIALLTRIEAFEGKVTALEADEIQCELKEAYALIDRVNTVNCVTPGMCDAIQKIARRTYVDEMGNLSSWLIPHEVECLCIPHGTLTAYERKIIEQHATITTKLLSKIQFGPRFSNVLRFAGAHHEKMDGSGYPSGLHAEELPVEVRLLTVLDIFEALTTDERPYKSALSAEQALVILHEMAEDDKLDLNMVKIFEASRVWLTPRHMEDFINEELDMD